MPDRPITSRQQALIEDMNEFCNEKFDLSGEPTLEEAREYISRNIDEFKLKTLSQWCLDNGYF